MIKKLLLLAIAFLMSPAATMAYNPILNTTEIPYEIQTISEVSNQTEYLGELVGYPHMYEFTVGAETTLNIKVAHLAETDILPLSLIVVKENTNNAGVTEVGRLWADKTVWQEIEDGVLALNLQESEVFSTNLDLGTYRIEVSTPDNYGKYMLTIGEVETEPGYFKTLGDIRTIQKFFGLSVLSWLASSYVYYPIGIIMLSVLIYYTWRYRRLIAKRYA